MKKLIFVFRILGKRADDRGIIPENFPIIIPVGKTANFTYCGKFLLSLQFFIEKW